MTRFLWFLTLATVVALLVDRNPGDRIPDLVRLLSAGEAVRWSAVVLLFFPGLVWVARGRRPAFHVRRRERPLAEVARRRGLAQDAVRVTRERGRGAAVPSGRHESPIPPDTTPIAASGEAPLPSFLREISAALHGSAHSLRKAEP